LQLNLRNVAIWAEAVESLTLILPQVIQRESINALLQDNVAKTFINLLYNPGSRLGQNREMLVNLFAQWVRNPRAFAQLRVAPQNTMQQNKEIFQLLVDGLVQGELDEKRDKEGIQNFLTWVDSWQPDRKEKLKPALGFLIKTEKLKELAYCIKFNAKSL
jgi:hypothetical protein